MKKDNTNGGYRVITEKTKGNKIYRTIMLVVLVAFITFFLTSIGMYTYFSNNPGNFINLTTFLSKDSDEKTITDKLAEYRKIIDKYYLKNDINDKDLEEGAIRGYIAGLNDKYTEYVSKEEMNEYDDDLAGEFVGIGIYMMQDKEKGRIRILTPMKGGTAIEAGIQAGDLIKSVNGVEYNSDQSTEVSNAIRGEEGTEVTVEVIRDDQTLTYTLKRTKVIINPVEAEVLENNIGYISFTSFDENTYEEFKNQYKELEQKGIKSLIIDIRNNGGGIVDQARDIAGCILDKGSTVLYEIDKNGNEQEVKTSTDPIINVPIVVLVNENTASSSEILVGALKDYEKVKIVGEKTYGKGIIQLLLTLPDGSGIKITSEEYLTPKRNKINEVGITPDEVVELPKEQKNTIIVDKEKDPQLQKAIQMLKQ